MKEVPGVSRRLASVLYEGLLLAGVFAGMFLVPHILLGMAFQYGAPGWMLLTHFLTIWSAYFLWYWSHGGKTLAMQTWKLKLLSNNGAAPSPKQIWIRYLVAWPSYWLAGVGILWALLDRDHQFLHDRIAGTRIVWG